MPTRISFTNLEVLPAVALVIPLPGLAVVLHLVLTIADLLMTIVCFNFKRLLQLQHRVHHRLFHLKTGLFLQYQSYCMKY